MKSIYARSALRMFILSAVCCVLVPCLAQCGEKAEGYTGKKENLHVYLLIGQSNMAGRAPFGEEDAGVIPGCYLLNGEDKWEGAKNPLNRYSTVRKDIKMQKMNPGYMFSKTMLEKNPSVSIGLVVNAKGGSRIQEWETDKQFYKEAIRRAKIAQKTGTLKGILWHQGEANCGDSKYLDKAKALIENLRKDLGKPNLPFVAGQINDHKSFNNLILKLPEKVPFTAVAKSDGLVAMDRWHFDTKSMKLLGQRYAEAMIRVQAKKKAK